MLPAFGVGFPGDGAGIQNQNPRVFLLGGWHVTKALKLFA
jgi:hypothetical protein